jgi:3-dehydroquinate synthase
MVDFLKFDSMIIKSHKGPYRVFFDEKSLEQLNNSALENFHFLVDQRVANLYQEQMNHILSSSSVFLIDATEDNKSLNHFSAYVQHLVDRHVRRDHCLIAIGGGIIQDITCFLAATLFRGMSWKFYPTTLLSQADSCIGSKSSINAGNTKNILGTFTPPDEVHICSFLLNTLEEKEIRSGVGEMLKAHAIDGPESFKKIAGDYQRIFEDKLVMTEYLRRSLNIKKRFIEEDEFDRGPRNIFNYGHSFGHALEIATNFSIPLGIAVSIGMDMANFVAMRLGIAEQDVYQLMNSTLSANFSGFELNNIRGDLFIAALTRDKKNIDNSSVTLILPKRNQEGGIAKGHFANNDAFKKICNEYLKMKR